MFTGTDFFSDFLSKTTQNFICDVKKEIMSSVTKKRSPSPSPPDLRKILKEIAAVDAPKTIDLRSLVEEAALVDSSPPRIGGNSTSAADIQSKKPLLLVKKKNGYSILFFYDRKLDRVSLTADLDGK